MRVMTTGLLVAAMLFALSTAGWAQPGGGRGFGAGGFGGGRGGGDTFLLTMPEVQKELGITDDQKGLLDDMIADLRQNAGNRPDFGSFRDLSAEEREKRMEELRKQGEERAKQAEDALKAILNDQQFARYNELRLQRQGVMALTRSEVSDKLGLTAEQKAKLEELRPNRGGPGAGGPGAGGPGAGGRPNRDNAGQGGQRPDFQALMAEARERREKQEAEILAVLTPDQKAKWDSMLGKKFDFPQPTFGGRPGDNTGNRQRGGNRPNNN